MIDKQALKEYIENNTEWGTLDESSFYIFPSWEVIRQANKHFQGIQFSDTRVCSNCHKSLESLGCGSNSLGGHYTPYITPTDVLELDELLGYIECQYPFPITQSDIDEFRQALYYVDLTNNGQLTFEGYTFEWPYDEYPPEIISQILTWYDSEEGDSFDRLYWLNDHIKDEIPTIEWGFDDEYSTCDNGCGNILRTSPDSYGWTPDYYESEFGRYCPTCAQDYADYAIQEIQDRIDNNDQPKSYPWIFNLTDEWVEITHPLYQHSRWENGLHPGQNDSPLKQGKIVRGIKSNNVSVFQVIYRVYPSQFTVEWETFIRLNPELSEEEVRAYSNSLGEWVKYFGDRFMSQDGRTNYDNVALLKKALQDSTKQAGRFNKITWDSEEGSIDIQSTDDYDEYTQM